MVNKLHMYIVFAIISKCTDIVYQGCRHKIKVLLLEFPYLNCLHAIAVCYSKECWRGEQLWLARVVFICYLSWACIKIFSAIKSPFRKFSVGFLKA